MRCFLRGKGPAVDERERRIAANEAVCRVVNAELEKLEPDEMPQSLLCECGDAACRQWIRMSVDEYRELRADPLTFAVTPGHAKEDVETVVAHGSGFDVVRKKGDAAALVLAEDPGPL